MSNYLKTHTTMTNNLENEIIKKVSQETTDTIFKNLSKYEYLTLTDILLIRYSIMNDIIDEDAAYKMLDNSKSVQNIKEYIQSIDALNKTEI